jgi:hypothetical protein
MLYHRCRPSLNRSWQRITEGTLAKSHFETGHLQEKTGISPHFATPAPEITIPA